MQDRLGRTGKALLVLAATTTLIAMIAPPGSATPPAASQRPVIRSLSVRWSSPQGGSLLRIHGTDLAPSPRVTIGGKAAELRGVQASGTLVVSIPAHRPGKAHVRVTTDNGTSAATSAARFHYFVAAHGDAMQWSSAKSVDQVQGGGVGLSCATTAFCVADDFRGNVSYFDGTSWSARHHVDSAPLESIACPTSTFCMAVDGRNRALHYDGTRWSTPIDLGATHTSYVPVTCGSPSLCLALDTDTGKYLYFDGATWTAPAAVPGVPTGERVTAISCAATRCLAGTSATPTQPAELLSFDGTTWTDDGPYRDSGSAGTAPPSIVDASCATADFCAVADTQGSVATINGTTIGHVYGVLGYTSGFGSLSCAASDFCMVSGVDDEGESFLEVFDGDVWKRPSGGSDESDFGVVSCPDDGFCGIGGSEQVSLYQSGALSQPRPLLPFVRLHALSCAGSSFCLADDRDGGVSRFDGHKFAATQVPIPSAGLAESSSSCATPTFCAFAAGTRVAIYNGSRWKASHVVDSDVLIGISCGSPTLCAATDVFGRVAMFNGRTWTTPRLVTPATEQLISVSCTGTARCAVLDADGGAVVYRHKQWGARHVLFRDPDMSTAGNLGGEISCGASTLCVAADNLDGTVARYDGHKWLPTTGIAAPELEAVSCAGRSFCLAIDVSGSYMLHGTHWTARHAPRAGGFRAATVTCASPHWCLSADVENRYQVGTV